MTYRLTPTQSLAWHSDDAEERETVRAEIRRAALARLGPHSEAARIVDAGGELLECTRCEGDGMVRSSEVRR